jgi:predicted RNA-binding protein YlxR (DUF448 family)
MAGKTGRAAARPAPERMCVVCRTRHPKRELLRVARGPDGALAIDMGGKGPGRGAYLCGRAECWQDRGLRGRLPHALGAPLSEAHRARLR